MKNKILLFATTLLLLSCSSTQKNKSKSVEESKTESLVEVKDKTNTTTNTESNTVTIDTTNTDETVIEPIDNSREFVINGKTYKNARIKTKRVKSGVIVNITKKVAKNEQKDVKTTVEATTQKRNVAIEKHKESNPTNFILIAFSFMLIILAFLFWWFVIRNSKNKN